MAVYPIIPNSEFFEAQSTNLATPDRFNALFNAINTRGVSEQGFIRPVQIAADYTGVAVDASGNPTVDTVTFYEVGSGLSPLDESGATTLYDITYAWSSVGSAGSATGATTSSSFSIELNSPVDPGTDNVQVSLTITYTDDTSATIYEETVNAGIPLIEQGIQGEPAISTAVPLLYAAFNHQPIDLVTGYAEITVQNVSMVPTAWGSGYNVAWSLTDSLGSVSDNYISSSDNSSATLQIPNYNKEYVLEMSIDNGSTVYTTNISLFTYKNGVLFLNWETDRVPNDPSFVTLSGESSPHPNTNFPVPSGSIKVKWGWDSGDFNTVGFESYDSSNSTVSRALIEAYGGVPVGDLREYGVLSIDLTNVPLEIVGQYLFIPNMTTPVLIDTDISSISSTIHSLSPNMQESGIFLIKGLPITGQLSGRFSENVSVGPGTERYYVHLQHYEQTPSSAYAYTGLYDQFLTYVPDRAQHSTSVTFNNVPSSTVFHASVVTSIGSVYSVGKLSADSRTVTLSTARTISGVEIEGQQFGVILNVSLGQNTATNPTGYLIAYKEYNITASVDVNSYSFASNNTSGFNVVYSNSSHIHLPATLGKKVVAWVKTVMADGSMSAAVNSAAQVVEFPASIDQSSLTKHLGRFNSTLPGATASWESSWESDSPDALMYTTHYTSFAKTTLLQGVTLWIHNMDTSASDGYDIVINLGGDENTVIATLDAADYNYVDPIPIKEVDLGKIVTAGSPISINIRNSTTDSAIGDLSGAAVDFTAELTYAYNYDTDNGSFASTGNSNSN